MLRDAATPENANDSAVSGSAVEPEAEGDEERLARQLAAVLARSPRRAPIPLPARPSDDEADDVPVTTRVTSRRYATALHHAPTLPPRGALDLGEDEARVDDAAGDEQDRTVAAAGATTAATWLLAARRRRVMAKLGAAASWLATVTVGMAIIAVAAYVVFGDIANVSALYAPTQRPL